MDADQREEMRRRLLAMLEAESPSHPIERSRHVGMMMGILLAGERIGVLDEDDMRAAIEKLFPEAEGEPYVAEMSMGGAVAVAADSDEAALPDIPAPFRGVGYLRTILGPSEPQAAEEATLWLTSLELFEDGLDVRWVMRSTPSEPTSFYRKNPSDDAMHILRHPHLVLTDDRGTAYYEGGRQSGGPLHSIRGHHSFSPAVPDAATWLLIEAGEAQFFIHL